MKRILLSKAVYRFGISIMVISVICLSIISMMAGKPYWTNGLVVAAILILMGIEPIE